MSQLSSTPPNGELVPGSGVRSNHLASTVSATDHLRRTVAADGSLNQTRAFFGGTEATPDSGQALVESPASLRPLQAPPLPNEAPEWMRMARLMSIKLENAIASGSPDAAPQVARAWAAFHLGGYPVEAISKVAKLAMQAHRVLKQTDRADQDAIVDDCSTILKNGLPADVRRWMPDDTLRALVSELALIEDENEARVMAVSELLGWSGAAKAWAAEAIALALGEI